MHKATHVEPSELGTSGLEGTISVELRVGLAESTTISKQINDNIGKNKQYSLLNQYCTIKHAHMNYTSTTSYHSQLRWGQIIIVALYRVASSEHANGKTATIQMSTILTNIHRANKLMQNNVKLNK